MELVEKFIEMISKSDEISLEEFYIEMAPFLGPSDDEHEGGEDRASDEEEYHRGF